MLGWMHFLHDWFTIFCFGPKELAHSDFKPLACAMQRGSAVLRRTLRRLRASTNATRGFASSKVVPSHPQCSTYAFEHFFRD